MKSNKSGNVYEEITEKASVSLVSVYLELLKREGFVFNSKQEILERVTTYTEGSITYISVDGEIITYAINL